MTCFGPRTIDIIRHFVIIYRRFCGGRGAVSLSIHNMRCVLHSVIKSSRCYLNEIDILQLARRVCVE